MAEKDTRLSPGSVTLSTKHAEANLDGPYGSLRVCYVHTMTSERSAGIRRLRGLKNISWLSARQLNRLAAALAVTTADKREVIIDEKHSPEVAYVLLTGVARITCRNRKGDRILVIMVAPGMIPGFPPPVPGISYNFRCEAVTECQIGTIELKGFVEISLGIASDDFKRMALSYLGRWDLVQLRCANFMSCTLEERIALILLELSENFGVKEKRGTRITITTRHKDLADLVSASRPRVTEFLIQFESEGMIVRDQRHLIVQREKLEAFLAEKHPGVARTRSTPELVFA
jgi:CRP-like cAMP-binding protein